MSGDASAKSGEALAGRRYVVRGRVQGVGFRWWTQREACALNLTGTVCNRPDGAVEVMARGTSGALARLESRLRKGPPAARVDEIEHLPHDPSQFNAEDGFRIVRSE